MNQYDHPTHAGNGLDQCVLCGSVFGEGEGFMSVLSAGPVFNTDTGVRYDTVGDSGSGEPLSHEECFKSFDAGEKADNHRTLAEF